MIVICIILILIGSIFLTPIRVKIKYHEKEKKELSIENKIEIYILYFLKVKTIRLNEKQKIAKENANYKMNAIYKLIINYIKVLNQEKEMLGKKELINLFQNIYYEKLYLNIGINLENAILNAYVITLINVVLNLFMMKTIDRMKQKNVNYNTYISKHIFDISINAIVRLNTFRIVIIIFKVILKVKGLKMKNKNHHSNMKFVQE